MFIIKRFLPIILAVSAWAQYPVPGTTGGGGGGSGCTAGTGITCSGSTINVDTAVIQSRATAQAGTSTYCRSATGNDTYTCALTPTLTAYTTGMCLAVNPDTANTGAATINVDALGAKNILTRSLATLSDGDLPANINTTLCYDGTQFVPPSSGGSLATLTQIWCPFGNCYNNATDRIFYSTADRVYMFRFTMDRTRNVRVMGAPVFPWSGGVDNLVMGIYSGDGSTLVASCNTTATAVNPSGAAPLCRFSSTVALAMDTEYVLAVASDTTTVGMYCSANTYEWNQWFGAQPTWFPNSRAIAGYGANTATSSGATYALPSTTGAMTASSIGCFPQMIFLPQ